MKSNEDILIIENLSQAYGSRPVFKNINLQVNAGEFIWLTGENGAGKTTLLKTIAGILKPTTGHISFSSDKRPSYFSPQSQVYQKLTVLENTRFFSKIFSCDEPKLFFMLKRFELESSLGCQYRNLSFGQKMKVLLVLALTHPSPSILLDEPYTGLDTLSSKILNEEIKNKIGEGKAIVCATHQFGGIEGVEAREFRMTNL